MTSHLIGRIAYSRSLGRPNLSNIVQSVSTPDPTAATGSTLITVNNAQLSGAGELLRRCLLHRLSVMLQIARCHPRRRKAATRHFSRRLSIQPSYLSNGSA